MSQKHRQRKHERTIARLAAVIEVSNDAIIGADSVGRITDWNPAAQNILGYAQEEVIGKPLSDLFCPSHIQDADLLLASVKTKPKIAVYETRWMNKTGRPIDISLSASGIWDTHGAMTGLCLIASDVTEKKEAEAKLKRYRDFIEDIDDGCFEIDLNGRVTYVNRVVEKRMGYAPGELIGAERFVYAASGEPTRLLDVFQRIFETGEPATVDDLMVRDKDGSHRYVSLTISLIRDEEGNRVGFRGTTRDVTEKKQVQTALEQSEARYRNIFLNSKAVLLLIDPQTGAIIDANEEACVYYGDSRENLLKRRMKDIVAPGGRPWERQTDGLQSDGPAHYESLHRLADGKLHPVEVFSGPLDIDNRRLILIIVHDLTQRHEAEEALRISEGKYRTILENISEGYVEHDLAGNFTFVNAAVGRITGYSKDELLSMNYRQLVSPETAAKMFEVYNRIFKTGKPETLLDFEILHRDGSRVWVELNAMLIRDQDKRPTGYRVMARDVTEKKKAEASLRRSEEKYRSIMDGIMEGYIECDADGNFTFVNDAACTMLGYPREDLLKMNYRQISASQTAKIFDQTLRDILATGRPKKLVDFEVVRKDGSARIHQYNLSVIRRADGKAQGVRAMGRDITELKWAEEALRQSEERIRLLFRSIPVPTFVWKAQHDQYILSEFNSAAFQWFGDRIIGALGKPAAQFFTHMPQIACDIARCMEQKRNVESEFWYPFEDRAEKRYVIVKYAFAPPDSVLMHVSDITGQKRAEENLHFISIHDSLTGLFNRFYSDAEIQRLAISRLRPISVIVIDLNDLKKINDESGHAMGDLYIQTAANLLKQTFRPEDMIARVGGDEFLILLPLVDQATCIQAVDRLNESVRLFNLRNDFPISLSAGYATANAGDHLLQRIREADRLMYQEKANFKASRTRPYDQ